MVFILFYLVTSIIAGDFYKIPITVAFMVSSAYAVIITGGLPLMQRINIFSKGAATEQMMLMIWIFILAGAFAHSAKMMGSIDATVNRLFHLPLHRYECRYHCRLGTHCRRRGWRDEYRCGYDDGYHRGGILLWR